MSLDSSTTQLSSKFAPQPDQVKVTIFKRPDALVYQVEVKMDEEQYIERNRESFYSSQPITPKEHLRMQQLLERESRQRCLFSISYKDITNEPTVITVERNELLHAYLRSELC
jgi:hypothetical protein